MSLDTSLIYDATQSAALTTSTAKKTGSGSTLDMEDFLKLLVAQMSNQDMYNTMDSTEYMGQLAQFSMIESLSELQSSLEDIKSSMADMSEIALSSYSAGMIGKEAVLAVENADGTVSKTTGLIEGVSYYSGETKVIVDGQQYSLTQIMQLNEPNIIVPDMSGMEDQKEASGDVTEESADVLIEEPADVTADEPADASAENEEDEGTNDAE